MLYFVGILRREDANAILKGKRVAVIGSEPSAIQFVPKLVQDPSIEVVQFHPRPVVVETAFSGVKWMFAHIPEVMHIYCNRILL
ncbi:hypothetical protein FIBSPDRAFT_957335 [Athelia psychrophila]|uniref:FAD/NAD(P)-binding domain-containing protein n=1 Tax=Athelia psychrophila TaxID=1759441 RepID=A0A166FTX9_9AGAM|nr:hypothetical protein FIBSPDRAFT_957335 [Fibularhizoctonia sp. CBS 109695]